MKNTVEIKLMPGEIPQYNKFEAKKLMRSQKSSKQQKREKSPKIPCTQYIAIVSRSDTDVAHNPPFEKNSPHAGFNRRAGWR